MTLGLPYRSSKRKPFSHWILETNKNLIRWGIWWNICLRLLSGWRSVLWLGVYNLFAKRYLRTVMEGREVMIETAPYEEVSKGTRKVLKWRIRLCKGPSQTTEPGRVRSIGRSQSARQMKSQTRVADREGNMYRLSKKSWNCPSSEIQNWGWRAQSRAAKLKVVSIE